MAFESAINICHKCQPSLDLRHGMVAAQTSHEIEHLQAELRDMCNKCKNRVRLNTG